MIQNETSPPNKFLSESITDLSESKELLLHQLNLHRIDELQKRDDIENTWKSCCLRTDRRAVIFFSQLSISITVMGFCCVQLVRLENCEAQSLYSGLLSLVIGIHLPQPKIKK
tara:strand:+ start:3790 stop:4128 length:339 start_codon:yes stop_codon:yes gene_type:complete